MKNGIYNLYIESDEEVTTIISRLHTARAQKIALIVPQHALVLQSIINLRLLVREAHKREREIVIVTADDDGAAFATRAGITTIPLSQWNEGGDIGHNKEEQRISDVMTSVTDTTLPEQGPVEQRGDPLAADEIGSQGFFAVSGGMRDAQEDVDSILITEEESRHNSTAQIEKDETNHDGDFSKVQPEKEEVEHELTAQNVETSTQHQPPVVQPQIIKEKEEAIIVPPHRPVRASMDIAPTTTVRSTPQQEKAEEGVNHEKEVPLQQKQESQERRGRPIMDMKPQQSASEKERGNFQENLPSGEEVANKSEQDLVPTRERSIEQKISEVEPVEENVRDVRDVRIFYERTATKEGATEGKQGLFTRKQKKTKKTKNHGQHEHDPVLERPQRNRFPLRRVLGGVSIFLFCAYFILPFTVVTLTWTPRTGDHEVAFTAKESYKNVDQEKRNIPLRVITKDAIQKTPITPTGTEDIDAQKAYGTLTIYNAHNGESQNLVATTRFETPDGTVFRLARGVSIPGMRIEGDDVVPGTVEVSVVADQPGEGGNVSPVRWTIPGFKDSSDDKYENFYAESTTAMTGGSAGGDDVSIVTEEDIARAKGLAEESREQFINDTVKSVARDTEFILSGAVETAITREESLVEPGTATEEAFYTTTISIKALVLRQADIDHVVSGAIFEGDADVRDYGPQMTYENIRVEMEDEKIFATARIQLSTAEEFDTSAFLTSIVGEEHDKIAEVIRKEYPGVSHVSLSAYPSHPESIGGHISRFPWMTKVAIEEE